jgi:hypothetical protein
VVDDEREREPYEAPRAEALDPEDARIDTAACILISRTSEPESRPAS